MSEQRICWTRLVGPTCGLAALATYLTTLSRGAFPGESARMLSEHACQTTFGTPNNPLWNLTVTLLAWLPFGDIATSMNVFSALCGAVVAGLLAHLMGRFLQAVIDPDPLYRRQTDLAVTLGALGAGLFLAFSLPFWMASNRAHTVTLSLLLLVCAIWLLQSLWLRFRVSTAAGLAFLCGVGVVESSAFVAAAPAFALATIYLAWRDEQLKSAGFWTLAPLAGLAGLALLGETAWRYMQTEGWLLSGSPPWYQIMSYVLSGNARELAGGLPQVGWLLVILVGIVPFVTMLCIVRRALNEERDWGFYFLHLMLTVILAGVVFNAPYSPWQLTGLGALRVTPYVLMAITWGYLIAYWTRLSLLLWNEEATGTRHWLRQWGGPMLGGLIVLATASPAWFNRTIADARDAGAVNAYARAVVQSLEGRVWLLTDGMLDHNLALAGRNLQPSVQLLNLRLAENATYMQTIMRHFNNPRLKSLADVGGVPFLKEWITTEPEIGSILAIMPLPDLWVATGRQAVPNKLMFFGYREGQDYDLNALWKAHAAFWREPFMTDLLRIVAGHGMLSQLAQQLLRQSSMVANNFGVLLEDCGRDAEGWEAYQYARTFTPDNISALMNQYAMLRRGYETADSDEVVADFENAMGRVKDHYRIWAVSRYYGYIRLPEAFVDLGMTWALSGQPGMAVIGLKKAIELSPAGQTDLMTASLAGVYLGNDQIEEGEMLFKQLLDRNPKNSGALLGLARAAIRRRQYTEADAYLKQAEQLGVPKERLALDYAVMELLAGKTDQARVTLQEVVELAPDMTAGWALLATVMIKQKDMTALREVERRLATAKNDFVALMVRGQIAMTRSDLSSARKLFEQALLIRTSSTEALEILLQLDVREARADIA
ncbi:MAG: tetratricopeptide repeat protein, partial [bacterium]